MLEQIKLGIRDKKQLPEGWTYEFFKNQPSGNTDCDDMGNSYEELRSWHEFRFEGKLIYSEVI